MAKHITWTNGVWLLLYLAVISGIIVLMVHVRDWQVPQLSTETSQANWQRYRSAVEEQSKLPGPVQRKVPKSAEPPALVLLRDHFPVLLTASLVFGTTFFAMAMFVIRKMFVVPPSGG